MLKNILNKNKYYYEVGVMVGDKMIAEYVTSLPIVNNGILHNKIMQYLQDTHGMGIIVLLNRKEGIMPKNTKPIIDVDIPKRQRLKYNR